MKKDRIVGTFGTQEDIRYFGEFNPKGPDTSLKIYGNDLDALSDADTIFGISHDMQRLTLLQCVNQGLSHSLGAEGMSQSCEIFPHFVLNGWDFFNPSTDRIDEVTFSVSDIRAIFQNERAFHTILKAQVQVEKIHENEGESDEEHVGDGAILSYFRGSRISTRFDTPIGTVSVLNVPTITSRGPFSTAMSISLTFNAEITFSEAINRVLGLRHFLSIIAGRPQGVSELRVHMKTEKVGVEHARKWLKVAWSMSPMESHYVERIRLDDFDLPIHAIRHSKEFISIAETWFATYENSRIARYRFIECMEHGASYGVARLVTAANMFDLLPPDKTPLSKELAPEIASAAEQVKALFKGLPDSPERNSVLTSIGLLGKPSLPKKVNYRAKIVCSRLGHHLPNLEHVLKIAVKTRNHFVHGSPFAYEAVEDYLTLMTESLEFVFIASDLIECGWNANAWSHKPKTANHPFARFLASYRDEIRDFLAASSAL